MIRRQYIDPVPFQKHPPHVLMQLSRLVFIPYVQAGRSFSELRSGPGFLRFAPFNWF
jgi:hypothetical protein